MNNDPDTWDEDEWIRRLEASAAKYNLPDDGTSAMQLVECINGHILTLEPDGTWQILDAGLWTDAYLHMLIKEAPPDEATE